MGKAIQNTSKEIQALTAQWQQAKIKLKILTVKNKLIDGHF